MESVGTSLLQASFAALSAIILFLITIVYEARKERRALKFDVYRRFFRNRHGLNHNSQHFEAREAFYEAFNEIYVAFPGNKNIEAILKLFQVGKGNQNEHLVSLIREICKDLGIQAPNEEAILRPLMFNYRLDDRT